MCAEACQHRGSGAGEAKDGGMDGPDQGTVSRGEGDHLAVGSLPDFLLFPVPGKTPDRPGREGRFRIAEKNTACIPEGERGKGSGVISVQHNACDTVPKIRTKHIKTSCIALFILTLFYGKLNPTG